MWARLKSTLNLHAGPGDDFCIMRVDDSSTSSSSSNFNEPNPTNTNNNNSEGLTSSIRENIIKEIIQTEKDYCNDLEVLISVYMDPMLSQGIVTEKEHISIFANIKEILAIHLEFLQELNSSPSSFGNCFLKVTQFLGPYALYCSNQDYSNHTLRMCSARKPFTTFLRVFQLLTHQFYRSHLFVLPLFI